MLVNGAVKIASDSEPCASLAPFKYYIRARWTDVPQERAPDDGDGSRPSGTGRDPVFFEKTGRDPTTVPKRSRPVLDIFFVPNHE